MNKIFKKIWNRARGCFVAVSEAVSSLSQNGGKTSCLLVAAVLANSTNSISAEFTAAQPSTEVGSGTYVLNITSSEKEVLNHYSLGHLGRYAIGLESDAKRREQEKLSRCRAIAACAKDLEEGYTVSVSYSYTRYKDGGAGDADRGVVVSDGKIEGVNGIRKDKVVGSAVNNGSNVVLDRIHFDNPDNTYTQNSGSTTIGDIEGPGKVIINGGDVTANGLLTIASAKPANINVKDLHSLANLNAISYAAGTKASFGGLTNVANSLQVGNATLKVGGDYTQNIRNQAVSAIKNRFGAGVNVVFTGNLAVDNSLDLSRGWTSEVLNSVFNENGRADYLFHTLNWNAEDQDQTIGSGYIQRNFGVKNIDNAGLITVNNGAVFAILGERADTKLGAGSFTADHGTLVFGANGVSSGGEAWNVSVINGGSLRIASGDFTIRNLRLEGTANNLGTLRLSEFQFGNNGHIISSGTLQTDRSKLFSIEDSHIDGLNVVDLGQTQPQEVREQLTEFFRKYVPENQRVLDEIVNHAQFTGGKVIVTNAHLTETQRDDLIKAFKDKFFLLGVQQETALPSASDEVLS